MPEPIQLQHCLQDACPCDTGLFESDKDFRTLHRITEQIAFEIVVVIDPEDKWWTKGRTFITTQDIRASFEDGSIGSVMGRWSERGAEPADIVLLAAVAMVLGIRVDKGDRKLLWKQCKYNVYSDVRRQQVRDALIGYQDGCPWEGFGTVVDVDNIVQEVARHAYTLHERFSEDDHCSSSCGFT